MSAFVEALRIGCASDTRRDGEQAEPASAATANARGKTFIVAARAVSFRPHDTERDAGVLRTSSWKNQAMLLVLAPRQARVGAKKATPGCAEACVQSRFILAEFLRF
jgi:hypothetical protein